MNLYRRKKTGQLHVMLGMDRKGDLIKVHYERVGGASGLSKEPVMTMDSERFFNTHEQITEVDVNRWRKAFDAAP